MIEENIDAFDVYWYDTFSSGNSDVPEYVEELLMQRHYEIFGYLPRWNNEI